MTLSILVKRMVFAFFFFFTFAVLTKFLLLHFFCTYYPQRVVGVDDIMALVIMSTLSCTTLLTLLSSKELNFKWLIVRSSLTMILCGAIVLLVSSYMNWLEYTPIQNFIIISLVIITAVAIVILLGVNLSKLERAVYIDPLTKAFNRRYFMETAVNSLNYCLKSGDNFALIMMDIDHFKSVNDTYGHLVGDEVLKTTYARISHTLASDTVAARIGGEEFVVMVTGAETSDIINIAKRMQRNLSATMFHIGDLIIPITASFGIAERSANINTVDKILENSDIALYRAKASGRNAIVHFDDAAV